MSTTWAKDSVRYDKDKMEAISQMSPTKDNKGLHRFLGAIEDRSLTNFQTSKDMKVIILFPKFADTPAASVLTNS